MIVRELIDALSKMGPHAQVFAYHCKDCAGDEVTNVVEEYGNVVLK